MVSLCTNRPGYFNDIAEEIRLFFHAVEIEPLEMGQKKDFAPGDALVKVTLDTSGSQWQAMAAVTLFEGVVPRTATYRYDHPAVEGGPVMQKRYEKRCVKIAVFRALRPLCPEVLLPWGSLTGIRPTRLLRELMEGEGAEKARRIMLEEFDVSLDKLRLCAETNAVQGRVLQSQTARDLDVYIGIPFCASRCLYCSFLSQVRGPKTDMDGYLAALKEDIRLGASLMREAGYRLRALYVGGGTPTVLTRDELADLMNFVLEAYGGFGMELTVEAGRPDTITREKLLLLKALGTGRISINPQTMNADTLLRIGRSHTPEDIRACYRIAREIGFESINMDVIAGLPGEGAGDMAQTLAEIEKLAPENLTVHTLAIKRSSKLKERLEEFPLADAEEAEEMVAMGRRSAARMGLVPYYMYRQKYMRGNLENVGYARPDKICLYNVDMMEETTSILAHGAGAMSKRIFGGEHRVERIPNPKDVETYIAKIHTVDREKRILFGLH
ncbi:MAG: coproporphyrinogen dehydrogenase HemZ [Clostridia bacterium]|nr:coproporphyrinogen dehydrogenase HemZ [Clostridia bacterium]